MGNVKFYMVDGIPMRIKDIEDFKATIAKARDIGLLASIITQMKNVHIYEVAEDEQDALDQICGFCFELTAIANGIRSIVNCMDDKKTYNLHGPFEDLIQLVSIGKDKLDEIGILAQFFCYDDNAFFEAEKNQPNRVPARKKI